MNWLYYLAEANLYLGIFYLVYCLLLNKETWYLLNRIYLLSTSVVAFVLPVVQLGFLKPSFATAVYSTTILPANNFNIQTHTLKAIPVDHYFTLQNCLLGIYLLGVVIFAALLVIKLIRLAHLTKTTANAAGNSYKLVHINDSNNAFSFFNYLFIGTEAADAEIIIRHELVHIQQKHSFDIILLEVIKIINWFNPLVYLLQNSLKTVHEYIADEQTASYQNDALSYSTFLVNNAYGIGGPSITHSFFNYNLLKKRIIMLNQKRSGSLARLKYLLIMPVCAGLLCVSTLGFSKTYGWVILSPTHSTTAVTSKVKTLRSTDGAIVGYGDKMTIHGKIYTVDNLTDADKAFLLKNYHIKLEVVEISGKPGQVTIFFPSKGLTDSSGSAAKVKAKYTSKGYKFSETGYVINGKSNFRVVITDKNGEEKEYFRNSATIAQKSLLKEKYGYSFPTLDIYPKLPPPPPMAPAPKAAAEKQVPGPHKVAPPFALIPDTALHAKPAPPPPMEPYMPLTNAFAVLNKYIAVHTRFPAVALENKIVGSVIMQFEINADHKLTDVKVLKGIGYRCDEEAARAVGTYDQSIDTKPGIYKVAVTFILNNEKAPKSASDELSKDPSFIGEVVVEGFIR